MASKELGGHHNTIPAAVKVRPEVTEALKSLEDRANWMRRVLENALITEGRLSKTIAVSPEGEIVTTYSCVKR